jgi:hypothetical protein
MHSSTSSSDHSPARRSLPWALLAALVAFGICEGSLWRWHPWLELCSRYAGPEVASDPLRTTARIALLPRHARQVPILLMGSSQIHEGLACEAFETRFAGRTCRNLGIAGGTPLDMVFLLDQVNRRVDRRIVVTGVFPGTLHRGPKAPFTDAATLTLVFQSRLWRHLDATEWVDLLYGLMQDVSPTLRAKDSLRALWDFVSRDPRAALRGELPRPRPRALDGRPSRTRAYFRQAMGVLDPSVVLGRFDATQEMALDRLIEGEASRGNRIVVIDFPTRRGYETTIPSEALLDHRRLVDRLASRPDVVFVPSAELPALSDDDFHDFTHLAPSGRRKISACIADILLKIGG